MAKLRELLDRRPRQGPALPAWIERLTSVGIISEDPQVVRRQRFTNVVAYAGAANAMSHLIINFMHGVPDLMLAHVYNSLFAGLMFLVPQLHRYGENVAANFFLALVVLGNLSVVWMFGSQADLHVYFTLAGVALFMLGVEHWRQFLFWFLAMGAALVISLRYVPDYGVLAPHNIELRNLLASHAMINAIIINALIIIYALVALRRAEVELEEQRERSNALVQIVFPTSIAQRLLSGTERRIADRVDDLSILFADIVGFSGAVREHAPDHVIDYLDEFVRLFDELCERHGIEKIKTIGDCYMAAGGLRGSNRTQAVATGKLALDMLKVQQGIRLLGGKPLQLRIGIHYGVVTAGIVGETRFSYDIWGDAVNVASRMESHGVAGRIQVSDQFRVVTQDAFEYEERGTTPVKGLGEIRTYFLQREK